MSGDSRIGTGAKFAQYSFFFAAEQYEKVPLSLVLSLRQHKESTLSDCAEATQLKFSNAIVALKKPINFNFCQ